MDNKIVLREELEKAIAETGCTLIELQEKGGPSIGNLSACLRGKSRRPISMKQLDALTKALGLPEGYYYEYYIDECFYHGRVSTPRMKAFLYRCAELGRTKLIQKTINILVEHPKYTELLFSVGEKLYLKGYVQESVLFYEEVIEGEKYNHSDRIAISQYRIFRANIGANSFNNYKALIRFESFRNKLPENLQLDALLQLGNVCYALELWPMVEQIGEELRILSDIVYQDEVRKLHNGRSEQPLQTERHLVVYYGKSYLMKSTALSKQGRYEEAKACIEEYEDLSWFKLSDDLGKHEVGKFSQIAKGNRYCLDLLLGNTDILDELLNFLSKHPAYTFEGLLVILEAANTYNLNIDRILKRFAGSYPPAHENAVFTHRDFKFYYQKAIYEFNRQRYEEGLETILNCLSMSIPFHKYRESVLCIMQFEKYIEYASHFQKVRLRNTLKEGLEHEN